MITLYHHGSSVCAAKVRLVLAEKGLAWDGVYVDILRGDQFDPAYMKLNPKAVVPTLVHDDKVILENDRLTDELQDLSIQPHLRAFCEAESLKPLAKKSLVCHGITRNRSW